MKRGGRIRARRKTRGGRNSDPGKLEFLRRQRCFVQRSIRDRVTAREITENEAARRIAESPCGGTMTVHHDRPGGSRATDKRTVPPCQAHHQHDYGPHSIERLGRQGFQEFHGIDMDDETAYYEMLWQAHKSQGVFE